MILLISTLIIVLIVAIYSKVKENKKNSFSKEYLLSLKSRPRSSNY
jgi:Na+/pantothenate symporter